MPNITTSQKQSIKGNGGEQHAPTGHQKTRDGLFKAMPHPQNCGKYATCFECLEPDCNWSGWRKR